MQPINEDAKQGGTEWAALYEPNGWTLAVATLTIDPHGQQRAMKQGLHCAQHVAMHPLAIYMLAGMRQKVSDASKTKHTSYRRSIL